MISTVLETMTWKGRHWLGLLGLIFLLQFLLIYFLSARGHNHPVALSTPAVVRMSSGPLTESKFAESFLASDPTLFALPGLSGFSGAAWLKVPAHDYGEATFSERKEPTFWLALNIGQLGGGPGQFVRTNALSPMLLAENSIPKIQTRLLPVESNAKTNSQLRIEGELASRALLPLESLQVWPHTNILTNSVAQIAVGQNGTVISARLLLKSGLDEADRSAMEMARRSQFAPGKSEIAWGNLIFDWLTIPDVATNAAPTIKPP